MEQLTDVRGRYYVDPDARLFSGNCVRLAPELFALDGEMVTYLVRQPESEEEERCRVALRSCPAAGAILDDGPL